jgi:hypothetical protein
MIWQTKARLGSFLAVAGLALSGFVLSPAPASALDILNPELDKTSGPKTRTLVGKSAGEIRAMAKKKQVYIDLKVRLDGKSKYAVMSSEEQDERRYNVDCRAGAFGRLPMGDGVEYYVRTADTAGKRIDLSFFPGSRTVHPDNDVSCVADPKSQKTAILRIRGIYKILTNDYGDRLIVELRPLTRASLSAADQAQLP